MGTLDKSRDYGTIVPGGSYAEQDGKVFRLGDGVEVDPITFEPLEDEVVEETPEATNSTVYVPLQWNASTKADISSELTQLGVDHDPDDSKGSLWRLYQDALKG